MDVSKTHTTNASLKWFLLLIAIISIALLSYPAKAETGTITLQGNTAADYNQQPIAVSAAVDFTKIRFDVGNYSQIEQLYINMTGSSITFASSAKSTSFTITGCGTGGGTASYSKTSNSTAWYFTNPSYVTCSPLVLSYTTNIFSDLGGFAGNAVTNDPGGGFLNLTRPAAIWGTGNINVWGNNNVKWNYTSVVDMNVPVVYEVNYPTSSPTTFNTSLTKTGTIRTLVLIENATGTPINYPNQENITFNNLSQYGILNVFGQGIALNLTIASGDFERVIVNTTGSGLAPVTPPNASDPNAPNCPVNCINTSKPTYNNTESVNVYGSFYPATTTVTDCLFFGFICTDTTISTESTTGYVFISTQGSTSPIKFLSFTPDMNNNYNLFTNLDIGTYQAQLWGFAGPGTTCPGGLVYDFDPTGKQGVPLGCYYPHNITNFNVVNASGNLSIVWQTKFSNSTAVYGDTVSVAWSNVTANDTVVIYNQNGTVAQSYNINQSTVSQIPVFIPLYSIGTWNATIYNASNHNHNATAYLNVVPPGAVDVANAFSITMYWKNAADIVNRPTLLNWNTGTYTGNYNISILQNGNEVRRNSYYGVPGQAQQASYTFGEQGAYIAQFLDFPNQTVQAQADIFISATTTTGGGTGGTTNESGNNLVGSSNLIFNIPWIGLMVLIVVIFGLVKNNVQGGNFVFAVAITTSIEAVIGLWEEWGIYITVLSWLLVGVFFKLNKAIEV